MSACRDAVAGIGSGILESEGCGRESRSVLVDGRSAGLPCVFILVALRGLGRSIDLLLEIDWIFCV